MGIRNGLVLAAAAALGAGVVVLPAVASSETPTPINAQSGPGLYEYSWNPSEDTIGEGATLAINNNTEVPHGVLWKSGPETPACTGVPVGAAGTKWTGTCTFKKAGTYVFWCSVHLSAMAATVIVTPGTTTTGTTGTTTPGGTTGTVPGGGGGGGTNGSPPVSPLASPAAPVAEAAVTAVKIRSQQRGCALSGSIDVSSAGAGGRLEVDLLAKRAQLASARSSFVRVGRTLRSAVGPGRIKFKVPLSASGRRALARAGRLALVVQITLRPRAGNVFASTRRVSLRP